jgi:hypothetical protein
MQLNLSNTIKLSLVSVFIILGITLSSCCSSDYICVKVKKSDLIPDSYELSRDSLIVGGIRICKMAQRFYNKLTSLGGGGQSFIGFSIPARLAKTEYGGYTAIVQNSNIKVYCTGWLTGADEVNPMKLEFVATQTSITTAVLN